VAVDTLGEEDNIPVGEGRIPVEEDILAEEDNILVVAVDTLVEEGSIPVEEEILVAVDSLVGDILQEVEGMDQVVVAAALLTSLCG